MKGLVHIYMGDGKGKTTAAIGLGIRAYGRGLRVLMAQFLKGTDTGELKTLEKLKPDFIVYRTHEQKEFIWNMNEEQLKELKKSVEETFLYAVKAAESGEWDLIILDEIMAAISDGLIDTGRVVDFIHNKPEEVEVVLTGRNAPKELIAAAHYVSDIQGVKHPFNQGITARKGIEF